MSIYEGHDLDGTHNGRRKRCDIVKYFADEGEEPSLTLMAVEQRDSYIAFASLRQLEARPLVINSDLIMPSLSIAIIAKNEEQHLARLLPLVRDLAEQIVVVVDTNTTDKTEEICRQFGAEVSVEEFRDLTSQKQSALDKCTREWYLSLDCDEFPDEEMLRDVRRIVAQAKPGAFSLRRRTFYLGRELRYAWQPDEHLRLVHRSLQPHMVSVNGHDQLHCDAPKTTTLAGWISHHSYKGIIHHFEKTLFYARIGAQDYVLQGRRFSILNLLINPWIAFVKLYVIRLAFLDGVPGLIAGVSTWVHVFLKYSLLWQKQKGRSH